MGESRSVELSRWRRIHCQRSAEQQVRIEFETGSANAAAKPSARSRMVEIESSPGEDSDPTVPVIGDVLTGHRTRTEVVQGYRVRIQRPGSHQSMLTTGIPAAIASRRAVRVRGGGDADDPIDTAPQQQVERFASATAAFVGVRGADQHADSRSAQIPLHPHHDQLEVKIFCSEGSRTPTVTGHAAPQAAGIAVDPVVERLRGGLDQVTVGSRTLPPL